MRRCFFLPGHVLVIHSFCKSSVLLLDVTIEGVTSTGGEWLLRYTVQSRGDGHYVVSMVCTVRTTASASMISRSGVRGSTSAVASSSGIVQTCIGGHLGRVSSPNFHTLRHNLQIALGLVCHVLQRLLPELEATPG